MASDTSARPSRWNAGNFRYAWDAFAWDGEADGIGGSQYRRAYAEWGCQGAPPAVWVWIAEWLERDGIGPLNVFDTDDDPVEDH